MRRGQRRGHDPSMTEARRTRHGLLRVVMVPGLMLLGGCLAWGPEYVCSEGEFPVYSLTHRYGGTCVREGGRIPAGFAAYPPRRVPRVVGDRYDRWPLAPSYPWRHEVDPALLRRHRPDR